MRKMRRHTKPQESLCDNCKYAYVVEGGSVCFFDPITGDYYDCPQRYCSKLIKAIHFGGEKNCLHYKLKTSE